MFVEVDLALFALAVRADFREEVGAVKVDIGVEMVLIEVVDGGV